MEEHFLSACVEGEPEFTPEPWFNPYGDCVVYQCANEAKIAERVDSILTLYRSAIDNRVIGFQIKDVTAIMQRFGLAGVAIGSETHQGSVVSVTMLLLAALNLGEQCRTSHELAAYARVFRDLHELPAKEVELSGSAAF